MLSRRQFISRSGTAGAALVIAPQAALEAAANGKARPLLRGGRFEASSGSFGCTIKRLETIEPRSRAQLSAQGYRNRLERGQKSIKGVNGPGG